MPARTQNSRKTIRLICWNQDDATTRARDLRHAGYRVIADPPEASGGMIRAFRELDPDAVVIDMDRLPSHGRELGLGLRASKSTCHLPLVFAGGVPAKVELVRTALPDAVFTAWDDTLRDAIERAMRQPAPQRLPSRERPPDTSAGALERKLDIKPRTHFVILPLSMRSEPWLDELLTAVPAGAVRQKRIDSTTTLAFYPVQSREQLVRAFAEARAALPPHASLWIVHPKQTSTLAADFNQDDVRVAGLASGFVDYKVCAVDKDWSALKFARRRITKAKPHIMPSRSGMQRVTR
jgi:hypothetical protein